MAVPRHILVFRFSALGDVAMTVPVIKNLLQQYPSLTITFVGQQFMHPLFANLERVNFYGIDLKKWNGLAGIYLLAKQIKKDIPFDAIADLHDSLRTKLIRFFIQRAPVAVIDKGRKEKEELTRAVNKKLRQLKTGFQRYADVFEKLGFPVALTVAHKTKSNGKLIGVAPFARHAPKMYPIEKMKEVVAQLANQHGFQICLFGSTAESQVLDQWAAEVPNVTSYAGKKTFAEELDIISQLNCMISMDSANMHFASLYGVPVISIWGGTHPYLGFYGWGQSMDDAVQMDLPCRPSSVFGNKPCPVHGDKGCMQDITPQMIVDKVLRKMLR